MELVFKMPDWMIDSLVTSSLRRIFEQAGYRDDEDFDVLFSRDGVTCIPFDSKVKPKHTELFSMLVTLASDEGAVKGEGAERFVAEARVHLDKFMARYVEPPA